MEIGIDKHIYVDDITRKITNLRDMYQILDIFEPSIEGYKININWSKVVIIVRAKNSDISSLRGILPRKYKDID